MKRIAFALSLLAVLLFATGAWAADKAVISKNVDTIVAKIDGGKDVASYKPDAFTPYVFILEEGGKLLVHPSLSVESLKEKAPPAYEALTKATLEGVWVEYEWKGKTKHTYAKKTKNNLIVGSGY